MVLREDRIGQQLLIPLDLRELIPKDHPSYFIQNVGDEIDFSKVDLNYCYKSGKPAYFRKMLLRLVLMGAFDGGLSGREVATKAATDISYVFSRLGKTRFSNNQQIQSISCRTNR